MRHIKAASVIIGALATVVAGCRTAATGRRASATCDADGVLVVRNYSGRVLEVYESGRGSTEVIGFASPGVTRIPVRGSTDLAVAYHVREPAEGRDAASVSWMRRTAVARAPSRIALELACR